VINEGPPGKRAMVKWKAATYVPGAVYLPEMNQLNDYGL
jgi:hypothetical protein